MKNIKYITYLTMINHWNLLDKLGTTAALQAMDIQFAMEDAFRSIDKLHRQILDTVEKRRGEYNNQVKMIRAEIEETPDGDTKAIRTYTDRLAYLENEFASEMQGYEHKLTDIHSRTKKITFEPVSLECIQQAGIAVDGRFLRLFGKVIDADRQRTDNEVIKNGVQDHA